MVGVGAQDIGDRMGLAMIITAIECCIPQAMSQVDYTSGWTLSRRVCVRDLVKTCTLDSFDVCEIFWF